VSNFRLSTVLSEKMAYFLRIVRQIALDAGELSNHVGEHQLAKQTGARLREIQSHTLYATFDQLNSFSIQLSMK
jgi:hypothetical protein